MNGKRARERFSTPLAPSRSWMSAPCTSMARSRPSVSVRMWRLRPLIFLPASSSIPLLIGGLDGLAVQDRDCWIRDASAASTWWKKGQHSEPDPFKSAPLPDRGGIPVLFRKFAAGSGRELHDRPAPAADDHQIVLAPDCRSRARGASTSRPPKGSRQSATPLGGSSCPSQPPDDPLAQVQRQRGWHGAPHG